MNNEKKKEINFLDKVLAPTQGKGSGRVFIALGKQEYFDLISGGRKNYGDLGLGKERKDLVLIQDFITKKEKELSSDSLSDEERNKKTDFLLFSRNIKVSLQNLALSNIFIQEYEEDIVLNFDSSIQTKYPFIIQFFIRYNVNGSIILDGLLKKIQPYKVSIRSFDETSIPNETEEINDINSLFLISSNDESLVKSLNQNQQLTQKLFSLSSDLEMLMINRKYFVVSFYEASNLIQILDFLRLMSNELINHQTGLKTVTIIKCFNCGSDLDENDALCPKCNAARPRCAICLLDLLPVEKEKVVQMPCCGAYGHRKHILMWIEKAHTCPNCKEKEEVWLDELNRLN